MTTDKPEVMLIGPLKPVVVKGLDAVCTVHKVAEAKDRDAFFAAHSHVRAIACSDTAGTSPAILMARFPNLELVSSFGVGYDHIDVKWAVAHNVVVTNTPGVLTEEVADTALGLLLCTVREFPQAERYLRAGKWLERNYPLTKATLRNRTVGMVGMGAIGQAIARRLAAFGCRWSITRASRGATSTICIAEPDRDGARGRYSPGHRARRAGDPEPDQRRSARCARP